MSYDQNGIGACPFGSRELFKSNILEIKQRRTLKEPREGRCRTRLYYFTINEGLKGAAGMTAALRKELRWRSSAVKRENLVEKHLYDITWFLWSACHYSAVSAMTKACELPKGGRRCESLAEICHSTFTAPLVNTNVVFLWKGDYRHSKINYIAYKAIVNAVTTITWFNRDHSIIWTTNNYWHDPMLKLSSCAPQWRRHSSKNNTIHVGSLLVHAESR